jgi:hypothetical protein
LYALAARTGAASSAVVDFQSPVVWGTSEPRHGSESVIAALELADLLEALAPTDLDILALCELGTDQLRPTVAQSSLKEAHRSSLRHWVARLQDLAPARRRGEVTTYRALASVREGAGDEASPPPSGHFRRVVHDEGFGYVARSFASIYILVLVFDDQFSELHAEAALLHALPVVERLVLALPPVEPPPKGGRVVKLPVPARD